MIQSILVASRFADAAIDYVKKRQRIEEKTVRLVSYRVTENRQNVVLREELCTP
jgi:hypothetical protein